MLKKSQFLRTRQNFKTLYLTNGHGTAPIRSALTMPPPTIPRFNHKALKKTKTMGEIDKNRRFCCDVTVNYYDLPLRVGHSN